jgi:hypothetical protein
MSLPVSLKAVVDEMDVLSDDLFAYLNPQTGELVTLSAEEIGIVEADEPLDVYPEWQQELIAKARMVLNSEQYLRLPTRYDIHDYAIMEGFCEAIEEPELRERLLGQIRGAGAFRRFKETIRRASIEEEWYRFRTAALETIAIDWLEAHDIPYRRSIVSQ